MRCNANYGDLPAGLLGKVQEAIVFLGSYWIVSLKAALDNRVVTIDAAECTDYCTQPMGYLTD